MKDKKITIKDGQSGNEIDLPVLDSILGPNVVDISSLEKKDILKLINQAYKMIPGTMKAIHFDILQNRNIFIPNVNRPLVKVFNGEEWVFKSLEDVTKIISDNIRDYIETWTHKYDKKLSPTKRKALNAFVAECIEGKMQLLFKDELKLFLMTYSQKLKDHVNEEITNNLEDLQIENLVEDNIAEANIIETNI